MCMVGPVSFCRGEKVLCLLRARASAPHWRNGECGLPQYHVAALLGDEVFDDGIVQQHGLFKMNIHKHTIIKPPPMQGSSLCPYHKYTS